MKKLSELEKLKYWLDTEFAILHAMFGVVMWQLTTGWFPHLIFGAYIVWSTFYLVSRIAVIAADDPNYLKIPRK